MPQEDPIRSKLRQVLLEDWDPHNASRSEAASRTYDAYLDPLIALIQSEASEDAVMDWLAEREKETMCFPSLGREHLRRVAQKLLRVSTR